MILVIFSERRDPDVLIRESRLGQIAQTEYPIYLLVIFNMKFTFVSSNVNTEFLKTYNQIKTDI